MDLAHPSSDTGGGSGRDSPFAFFALILLCLFVLFYHLGDPALFEPDEGRSAEIAREILLLNDWATPHYNFTPRLDKPIFFYATIALSYRLFGISEAAARAPSALAGLGCVLLTYLLGRTFLGHWGALWGGLILLTSMEYLALSHAAVPDMTLVFFITLALGAFCWAGRAGTGMKRRACYLTMYAGIGCATLVKGPVGVFIPGIVIISYLLWTKRWSIVREMEPLFGALVFLALVGPWYAWTEWRNPGYLRYFLLEENLLRFLTQRFHRGEPWYYFLGVLAAGFLPWTLLLPFVVADWRKRAIDDFCRFLFLWTALPFLFFSLSSAKLSQYILPIFSPLALLSGGALARLLRDPPRSGGRILFLPLLALVAPLFYFLLGVCWPVILPRPLRDWIADLAQADRAFAAKVAVAAAVAAGLAAWVLFQKERRRLYLSSCLVFLLFAYLGQKILVPVSWNRSSKELAQRSLPLIRPQDRIVIYDTYLSSLPFYLRIQTPIWVVWSGRKNTIMGSLYVAEKNPPPAPGYGQVLFTFEEFSERWKDSDRRLVVFVKDKNLPYLSGVVGAAPKTLLDGSGVVVVTNR